MVSNKQIGGISEDAFSANLQQLNFKKFPGLAHFTSTLPNCLVYNIDYVPFICKQNWTYGLQGSFGKM